MRCLAVPASPLVLVGLLLSCGGGGGGVTVPGSLTVSVTAPNAMAPSPAAVSVTVTGPGGYQKVLTATATLGDLAPGSYTISAAPSRVAGGIVATLYDGVVTGSPATVTSGGTTTASVTYPAARSGTGRLWLTDSERQELQGYTDLQLGTGGSPAPALALGTGINTHPYGVTVAPGGSLWAALPTQHELARYDPSQLTASGAPVPAATIATTGQAGENLAFDRSGNLWADVFTSSVAPAIVRFDAAGLTGNGSLSAAASLTWALPTPSMSVKVVFDAAGNLWILNSGDRDTHPSAIMRVDAGTLGATGAAAFSPAATITSSHVLFAQGAAFDADGALWIGVLNAIGANPPANLVRYSRSQLAVSGAHTVDPEAVIDVPAAGGFGLLAFDEAGDLWVSDFSNRTVSRLKRSLIVATGSYTVAPDIVISTPAAGAAGITGLAFDPPPPGLPLAQ